MTTPTEISDSDLKPFVVRSVLLSSIDPVRGEPTRSSLDEDPDSMLNARHLKQRFLDSFALICSTSSSGGETASAICLEQHGSASAILRVARNHGLTPEVLQRLAGLLQILRRVAGKVTRPAQAESDILSLIAQLDKDRIDSMAIKISKNMKKEPLRQRESASLTGKVKVETWTVPEFEHWLQSCPFTATSIQTTHEARLKFLSWASQARWLYSEQLQDLRGHSRANQRPWLNTLHKMARYHSATKSMIKLAAKRPEVFLKIQIQEVKAPRPRSFRLEPASSPVMDTVKSLVPEDPTKTMERLSKHLNTENVETHLRKAFKKELTLHAEMQLVVFYEGNPDLVPRLRFIGTSKKACFLCHEYLLRHPLRLQVSACHQKIYPTWMPPPYYPTSGQNTSPLFQKLRGRVNTLTQKDLQSALNSPRRPRNQDSTEGPSLTIMTTTLNNGSTAGTLG